MSNSFKICPTHFSREGEKFSKGGFSLPAPTLVTSLVAAGLGFAYPVSSLTQIVVNTAMPAEQPHKIAKL